MSVYEKLLSHAVLAHPLYIVVRLKDSPSSLRFRFGLIDYINEKYVVLNTQKGYRTARIDDVLLAVTP